MSFERSLEDKLRLAFLGHERADALRAKMLSPDHARGFQRSHVEVPVLGKHCELIAEYGYRNGGLVLELLQLTNGPCFGSAVVLTLEQCAKALEVDKEEIEGIIDQMMVDIRPALIASSEYQEFKKSSEATTVPAVSSAGCNEDCEAARSECEAAAQERFRSAFQSASGDEQAESKAVLEFRDALAECRRAYDKCLAACREIRR